MAVMIMLMIVIMHEQIMIMIIIMIKQGLDMSLCDYDGRTALHLAAAEGQLACVEVSMMILMMIFILIMMIGDDLHMINLVMV